MICYDYWINNFSCHFKILCNFKIGSVRVKHSTFKTILTTVEM